jgi:AcrR family transcriptional regulator
MAWDTEGTRRRLKEAATAEFAEYGRDGTTMTRIAARAGINKERLYSYYGDKNALWETVLSDELDRLAATVAAIGEGVAGAGLSEAGPSGAELAEAAPSGAGLAGHGLDIGEFAGVTYDYHAAHPELGRLLQWEGLTRGPAADADRRAAHYREKVARFTDLQREGHLDPTLDPAHLVFALIALAAWWQTVPQLAELITGRTGDDPDERANRRAFVVNAARRLAAPR